jgi:hypothetical protein
MGNDTSAVDGKDPKLSLVTTADNAGGGGGNGTGGGGAAAADGMGGGGTFLATTTSPSASSAHRRIIKATKPIPKTPTLQVSQQQQNVVSRSIGGDKDDDDDNNKGSSSSSSKNSKNKKGSKKGKDSIPNEIAESPSVVREIEQEKLEMIKQERKQSSMESQKAKRESILQQRRKGGGSCTPEPLATTNDSPQNDKDNTDNITKPTATPKKAAVRANPMSRFLSVFSVEPLHPEHKRMFEKSVDDDGTIVEPTEKKRRASDADNALSSSTKDNQTDKDLNTTEDKSSLTSKILTTSAAVAVAAVVVGILVRLATARRK